MAQLLKLTYIIYMKNITAFALFAASLAFIFYNSNAAPAKVHHSQRQATVAHIIDGDTFVTQQGEHIRLIGINTPEKARGEGKSKRLAEPYAHQARTALTTMLKNQTVTLKFGKKKKDKYKRWLADVYVNNVWINGKMIEQGAAHVYSFPDTANANTYKLLALEDTARAQNRGLWQLPRYRLNNANIMQGVTKKLVGGFHLVEGKITTVADVKNRLYLNFGQDWRTDFTAEIRPQDRKKFRAAGISKSNLIGKTVLVRGIIKPVNGMMITLTHPEQIKIIN